MNAAGIAFFESDPNGLITYCSKNAAELAGMSPSDSLGNGWVTNVLESDRDQTYNGWMEAIKQQRAYDVEFSFIHHDGKVVTVQAHSLPVISANKVIGYVGILEKISEQ